MRKDLTDHRNGDSDPLGVSFFNDDSFNFNFVPDPDVPPHVAVHGQSAQTVSPPPGSLVGSTSTIPDVDYHWDGITFAQSGGYYPPDNGFAAGAHVTISAVNDAIQFTTLTGSGALTETLETFFGSVLPVGFFLTDPRVLYDSTTHQFVVSVDALSNHLNASDILLAVSNGDLSAPSLSASNWQFESRSTTYAINGKTTWADQPLVSVDGHDIYVSTNQFSASGGSYVPSARSEPPDAENWL